MKLSARFLVPLLLGGFSIGSYAAVVTTGSIKNLSQVYQEALSNSPLLNAQKATRNEQKEIVGINLGRALPNVTIVGNVSITHASFDSAISGNFKTAGIGIALNQALLNYGVFAGYQYSKQLASAAESTYDAQQQSFIVQVSKAYFDILLAEDNVSLSETNLKAAESTLARAQIMFKTGMTTDVDVKQADANFYTAQATLVKNKNALEVNWYALYKLTGVVQKKFAPLKQDVVFVAPSPNKADAWFELAKIHNNNLIAQRYATEASDSLVDTADSLFLPSLSLTASYTATALSGNANVVGASGLQFHSQSGYIGLNLTWNILNGGADFATRLQAAQNYEAQHYKTVDIYRSLEQSTRNDFNTVIAVMNQVKALQQSVKSSKVAYEQFLEQYKVGTNTITDVLDQQRIMFQSMTDLAAAKYNYINSILRLKFDAGTISVKDIRHFNGWLNS